MSNRTPGVGRVPIISWLRSYDRSWLRGDLVAGVTVLALVVPKNLGYAGIAGIPVQNGLYAAAAGAILYAIFGTSRQISVGPSSGLAAVAASAVLAAGIVDEKAVASFVAGITLASGLLYLIVAVLRMGWIAQFLSRAVVTGFLFGAALDVVIGELPKLTGTKVSGSNPIQELWSWLTTLGGAHGATVVVGLLSLAVVFGLRVVAPKVPGALVLVVGGLLASWLLGLGDRGVALVGDVPRGLPSLVLPDLALMWDHLGVGALAAFALVLIGFSQTAGDARAFAAKHRYQIDVDQESVAQGVANAGAGLLQRMPVPAAIIIEAVVMGMMDLPEMRRLLRVKRFDFGVAVAALLGALVFGVLAGVMIGVALSIFWLIKVSTRPHIPTLAREPGTDVYRDLGDHPDGELVPGVAVIRMDGGLFFATSDALEDRVREVIHSDPGLSGIVLDCGGIDFIDSQGSAKMGDVIDLAHDSDLALRLARLKASVRATLEVDGVLDRLGADHVHGNIDRAVQAELRERANPPATRPDALPDP